jgi:hypothetical protein
MADIWKLTFRVADQVENLLLNGVNEYVLFTPRLSDGDIPTNRIQRGL